VHVVVPIEEFEPRARLLAGQFETLRTQDARRLDAVAEYANGTACRAWFLREYFGEDDGEACGMCDRCRGQADRPNSFWEPLAPPRGEERRRRGRGKGQRGHQGGRQPHYGAGQPGDGQQFPGRRNNRRRRRRGRRRDGQRFENGQRLDAAPLDGQPFPAPGGAPEGETQRGGSQPYERISMDDIAAEAHGVPAAEAGGERPEGGAPWPGGSGGFRRRRRGRRRGGRGRRWRERYGDGPPESGGGDGDRGPGGPPESSGAPPSDG
jgi:hypothetical protein